MNLNGSERIENSFVSPGERLAAILKTIEAAPPQLNASDAANILADTFERYETALYLQGKIIEPMVARRLQNMQQIKYKGKNIFVAIYDRHVCFIAESGAIDIRQIEELSTKTSIFFEENPTYAPEKMPLVFEKTGSDGQRVWG